MNVLALEASTSSAKAMVYNARQGVLSVEVQEYHFSPAGRGMQDSEAVLNAVAAAGKRAAAGRQISAISVGGTWHSILILASDMQPVSPTYTWEYLDSAPLCGRMRRDEALTNELYTRTGCMPHITYMRQVLLYLKEQGMDFTGLRFATQGAYNYYRLTGSLCETPCIMSGTGLLNLHSGTYDPFVMSLLGIAQDQFGEMSTYRQPGALSQQGARLLGLETGIPVVPPYPDGALNQIGSGAEKSGIMTLSVGTSAALRLIAEQPILPAGRQTWCYQGVEGWISGAATAGGCNCINWFRDTLLCKQWSFEELEQGADRHVPIFLPFLFGERCPGWNDSHTGGFMGITGANRIQNLYHGIQQGVLFNIRHCYDTLCQIVGIPETVVLSGGILHSERWSQMAADILERPIVRSATTQASLLGGVALALHAMGELNDVTAFRPQTADTAVLHPNTATKADYRARYDRYLNYYEQSNVKKESFS